MLHCDCPIQIIKSWYTVSSIVSHMYYSCLWLRTELLWWCWYSPKINEDTFLWCVKKCGFPQLFYDSHACVHRSYIREINNAGGPLKVTPDSASIWNSICISIPAFAIDYISFCYVEVLHVIQRLRNMYCYCHIYRGEGSYNLVILSYNAVLHGKCQYRLWTVMDACSSFYRVC